MFLGIFLIVLAPLVNGPIFRKVLRWQVDKALHDLYLKGDYDVKGTILGGLEIDNLKLEGSRNIRSIDVDHIEVRYRFSPFLKGNWGQGITKVHLNETDIRIDNSREYPTDPEIEKRKAEKKAKKANKKDKGPSTLWTNLDDLLEQDLAITDFSLGILGKDSKDIDIDRFTFQIKDGSGKITAKEIDYPNGDVLRDLNATLASAGDTLIEINGLDLNEELAVNRLTATTLPPGELPALSGNIELLGGVIDLAPVDEKSWTAKLASGAVDLGRIDPWLKKDIGIKGKITGLDATVAPSEKQLVDAKLKTENLAYRQYSTDTVSAEVIYGENRVDIGTLDIAVDTTKLNASGTYDIANKNAAIKAKLDAPQLSSLASRYELPEISGVLNADVDFRFDDGDVTGTTAKLKGSDLIFADNRLQELALDASATNTQTIAFLLKADIDGRQSNLIESKGSYALDTKNLLTDTNIDIADLSSLNAASAKVPPLAGSVSGTARVGMEEGKLTNSKVDLRARSVEYQGAKIASANLQAETTAPNVLDFSLQSDIDAENRLSTSGNFDIDQSTYRGEASLDLPKIANLHQKLEAFNVPQRPTGNFKLTWTGNGSMREKNHRGSAKIPAFEITPDKDQQKVAGNLDLDYAPDSYRVSNLLVRSEDISVTGAAQLENQRLDVDSLRLFNAEKSIARADVSVPFDTTKLKDMKLFLEQPGDVTVKIDSDKLQLAELIEMTGKEAGIAATIDAAVDITGTYADPQGTGRLEVLQFRNLKNDDLAPADARLNFGLGGQELTLNGKIEHPEIQPITISGRTPLRFDQLDSFAGQSIELNAKMPETQLAIVQKYVPDLTSADGTIALDVEVAGTVEKPELSGLLQVRSPLLKFKQQKIPTINDLDIKIRLAGDQVLIDDCRAYVAGGDMRLSGGVSLPDLTKPEFDISLDADQALVFRDDSVSVRANLDLDLRGPMEQAALTGKIGITQSRFFKEIEILPIGLPRSSPTPAAPRAPSFGTKKDIGLTAAPLNAWTLDVKIVTDDAFLVRSNLATADIIADLGITGTFGKPIPAGTIRIEEGRATLPFSEVETNTGIVTFSPETGFDPRIDVNATSKVQDYDINLIVYGQVSGPKTLITSDPPLPESEAISLLATGNKLSDYSNSDVIAGDAALLLIDKLRRKYAKGTPIERRPGSLRDTLKFKAGQIDPRTGKRSASAQLEVTEKIYLLGNVNVEGDYRGLVKYIFRFK